MSSYRLRPFSHWLLALFLTFTAVGQVAAQDNAAVSKEGVTPAETAAAAPAAAAGGAAPAGDAAAVAAGDALFKGNCAQCHAVNDVVVGPALAGIDQRRPLPWIISWIKNSSKMVASGDEYAVKIFNQYQKQQMPSFALSDAEITSIVAYVKSEAGKSTAGGGGATGGGAGTASAGDSDNGSGAAGAEAGAGKYVNVVLIVLVVVLIVLVVTLVIIANIMKDVLRGRKDLDGRDIEMLDQKTDWMGILKSGWFRGTVGTLFVLVILYESIQGLMAIGLQQGYQPAQPIAFSHKLHAGEHQINCAYCHTSVYKSKSANIPSANICMNCHSQIKTTSPEIKKIYRAIQRNQPIQWVRIHNLPDLAYFNHSQHTQVGGLQCQTCHGPIQNMDVVYQYSALTMGWCINCHRETPLNTKGNGYYDNLVKLHDTANAGAPFTVSSNGGTECSKCHY